MQDTPQARFNQPVSGLVTPRFGGIATFMRLPHVPLEAAEDIEIGLVGIPWDGGPHDSHGLAAVGLDRVAVRALHP